MCLRLCVVCVVFGSGSVVMAQPCSPVQAGMVVADDGDVGDGYGWSVGIDGDTAVVGSHRDDAIGSDSGSVYVLYNDGSGWDEVQKLVGIGIGSNDGFGDAVAISGDTIVVGAPGDDDVGTNSGAAYVFTNVGGVWTQTGKLIAPPVVGGDNYASAVDVDGDIMVISASLTDTAGSNSGAAYIYRRIKGTWTYDTRLQSDDIAQWDRFGIDVAVSGNRVLIGADSDDDNGSSSGSVYVFDSDGSVWTQEAKLSASDGAADDQFGERVDISGDSLIVGARYDDDLFNRSGSAYIFEHDGSSWSQAIKLTAFDAAGSNYFGQGVAIHNNRAVVGAWGRLDAFGFFNAGAAYAYSRSGGVWSLDAQLIASDSEGGDFYGYAVGVTDDYAVIGADGNDDFWWGPDAGSVYLIALNCETSCLADLTGDGSLDFFDVSAFLAAFGSGDLDADFTGDGVLDFFDVSAFLTLFGLGCPQ